jgi:GTP-binding protein LepA
VLWRRRQPQAQAARQAEGSKKKMRQFGRVEIPQEAFIAALKMDEN